MWMWQKVTSLSWLVLKFDHCWVSGEMVNVERAWWCCCSMLYVCMADCGNNSLILERVARNHVGVATARHGCGCWCDEAIKWGLRSTGPLVEDGCPFGRAQGSVDCEWCLWGNTLSAFVVQSYLCAFVAICESAFVTIGDCSCHSAWDCYIGGRKDQVASRSATIVDDDGGAVFSW